MDITKEELLQMKAEYASQIALHQKELLELDKEALDNDLASKKELASFQEARRKEFVDFCKAQKSTLSFEECQALDERKGLKEKKHSFLKWLIGFAVLFGLTIGFRGVLQEVFSWDGFCFFAVFAIVEGVLASIIVRMLNLPYDKKIKEISAMPNIAKYDSNIKEFMRNTMSDIADMKAENADMKVKNREVKERIQGEIARIASKVEAIDDRLADLLNPNQVFLITGSSYRYQVYLDGLLYQEHQGKNVVSISVSEGLHTLRLVAIRETSDKITTYQLGTLQFQANNDAHYFVADGFTLEKRTRKSLLEYAAKKIKGFSLT